VSKEQAILSASLAGCRQRIHHYPEEAVDRMERLNLVMEEAAFVVVCFDEISNYLERKGLIAL